MEKGLNINLAEVTTRRVGAHSSDPFSSTSTVIGVWSFKKYLIFFQEKQLNCHREETILEFFKWMNMIGLNVIPICYFNEKPQQPNLV